MKTTQNNWMSWMVLAGCVLALGAGCGEDDGEPGAQAPADGAEYSDSVPSALMVDITEDGDSALSEGALAQALVPDGSVVRQHVRNVRSKMNDLIRKTHNAVDTVTSQGTLSAVEIKGEQCRQWDHTGDKAQWRLIVCKKSGQLGNIQGQRFGWLMGGKALDAAADAAYLPVAAGESVKLEGYRGGRGGVGRIGYNFDNLATLRGESYGGKLGLGYRANGKARQVVLGLKAVKLEQQEEALSALYRYTHVLNRGGRLVLATKHDLIKPGADGGFEAGQDGVDELGRASIAWNKEGRARITLAACGGTLGQGQCALVRQCWQASGEVSFEQVARQQGDLMWEPTACGVLVGDDADAPPTEAEIAAPAGAELEDSGAPSVDVPAAIDGE
jgi:hypothetical protein